LCRNETLFRPTISELAISIDTKYRDIEKCLLCVMCKKIVVNEADLDTSVNKQEIKEEKWNAWSH
jgi:hypothetical protein